MTSEIANTNIISLLKYFLSLSDVWVMLRAAHQDRALQVRSYFWIFKKKIKCLMLKVPAQRKTSFVTQPFIPLLRHGHVEFSHLFCHSEWLLTFVTQKWNWFNILLSQVLKNKTEKPFSQRWPRGTARL